MVQIIYGDEPGTGPEVEIPLGALRRNLLIVFGTIMTFIGISSTYLFQQISKRDNNLRQRGRYLVTLQGYFGTLWFAIVYSYQAFKYRYPCVVLYWAWRLITRFDRNQAIYQSRFAEPADLAAALGTTQPGEMQGARRKGVGSHQSSTYSPMDSILVPSASYSNRQLAISPSDPSLVNLSALKGQLQTSSSSSKETPHPHHHHYVLGQERVFELTHQTLEEIAQSKKWYNRYRSVTDRQMFWCAVVYMVLCTVVAIVYQFQVENISTDPLSYNCHSGPEYVLPYASMILFLFVLSPFMTFQLRGINDGFGIRNELIFTSIFSVPCVVLFFVMPLVAPQFTRRVLDKTTFVALIIMASHLTSTVLPLIRHFKEHPHQCAYTARAFQRKSQRKNADATTSALSTIMDSKEQAKRHADGSGNGGSDGNEGSSIETRTHGWSRSEGIPMESTTTQTVANDSGFQAGAGPMSPPVSRYNDHNLDSTQPPYSGHIGAMDDHSTTDDRKNSGNNINQTFKSLIRSQRRERFKWGVGGVGIGMSHGHQQGARIDSKKTDWDEFMKALENRALFDKMSAFTVREFCAENMRFLYEVSRLEKRAVQYEHLRRLTSSASLDVAQDTVTAATVAGSVPHAVVEKENVSEESEELEEGVISPAPRSVSELMKSSSTGTRNSTIAPLPTHFSAASSHSSTPHRIKKIISASSVSSTVPILGLRRSSSSYFDESEPSSPLGSSPHSTFQQHGSSSMALPDLESGMAYSVTQLEQKQQRQRHPGFSSISLEPPLQLDLLPIPSITFAPLPMPPTLLIQFEYIYKTFIVSGARLELNLSHDTYQEIHQRARKGDWGSGMFDGAIYEIQELLFRDVWPKFVTSSHGLNYNGSTTAKQQQSSSATMRTTTTLTTTTTTTTIEMTAGTTRVDSGGCLQEVGVVNGSFGDGSNANGRTPVCLPFEQRSVTLQQQRSTPSSSIMMTSPESSLSGAISPKMEVNLGSRNESNMQGSAGGGGGYSGSIGSIERAGSVASSRTQGTQTAHVTHASSQCGGGRSGRPAGVTVATEEEEFSRAGLKSWLTKKSRTGITAAALISMENGTEESLGIIEQSRKSMVDRRSDTSGLYSTSVPNSLTLNGGQDGHGGHSGGGGDGGGRRTR
ncbi:hypothetical protein EDD11_006153 [Mortierella claussenii]|nr:hypothetical protein EDD11_006153 [Mortierella claussenii]